MADLEGELAFRLEQEDVQDANLYVLTLKDSCLNYSSTDTLKPAMKDLISSALNRGRKNFVINMRSVGVVDSCGLSVLISLKKQVEQGGGKLALVGLNGMIQRLFGVTRLDKAFPTFETQESAVTAFQTAS